MRHQVPRICSLVLGGTAELPPCWFPGVPRMLADVFPYELPAGSRIVIRVPSEVVPHLLCAPYGWLWWPPMAAVGPSPLVGTGCTVGAYPNRVRVLRSQTREFGGNTTGTLPFLGDFLDRVAELVERLSDLRPGLVAHNIRTRQVAVHTPPHPPLPSGH